MKISKLLLFSASLMTLAACSDYDNGYTEEALRYAKDFAEVYGPIDSLQDWNLAERANVTVTTSSSSNVKIYASTDGNTYSIVGDYAKVNGTETLSFDVLEGTEDIIVSDGKESIATQVGESVVFAAHRGTSDGIEITTGNYITFTKEQATAYDKTLPEINNDNVTYEQTNLPKVTKNFKYVSKGEFSFYPVFWTTSGADDIYIYYTDGKGVDHEVLVYSIKSGNELLDVFPTQFWPSDNFNDAINAKDATEQKALNFIQNMSTVSDFSYDNSIGAYKWTCNGTNYIYYTGNFVPAEWDNSSMTSKAYLNACYTQSVTAISSIAGYGFDNPAIKQLSQEIQINIPAGTEFGFMLKNNGTYKFYSQAEKNETYLERFGDALSNEKSCYAASINIGGDSYICFEDWYKGDFDLNDVVFKFAGNVPTVIDEDPQTSASWILACEDLGGSFDTDYNDVVLQITHISGKGYATVTPLAAGGTLASYIFHTYNDKETCIGEIHQLFGRDAETSGSYAPINVGMSRGSAGIPTNILVGTDWSMANANDGNMGGFSIRVLPAGKEPITDNVVYSTNSNFGDAAVVSAPGVGETPEMVCIPYTYTKTEGDVVSEYVWAWPRELITIADGNGGGVYPQFAGWVSNHTTNTDWYKYPNVGSVSELKLSSQSASVNNTPPGNDVSDGDDEGESDDDDEDVSEGEGENGSLPVTTGHSFTYKQDEWTSFTFSDAALIDFSKVVAPVEATATLNVTFSTATGQSQVLHYKDASILKYDYNYGWSTAAQYDLSAEELAKAISTGGIYIRGWNSETINVQSATLVIQ